MNQLNGLLLGEAMIGLAELAAAVSITRQSRGWDVFATLVSLVSGLLCFVYLTKAPLPMGLSSLLAMVAVLATLCTIGVSVWDAVSRRQSV
jgi:hypothetical protein